MNAAVIFASAFLIFLVQPVVGKRILPWFGGAPAVWTLCLAFYQSTLFLGYAYAHLLIRFAGGRLQLGLHALAAGAALLSLPVLPDPPETSLAGADPTLRIVAMLASNVALPFMLLASTGPLVQAWFARSFPSGTVYRLFALSNFASLLALIAYPPLIEPWTPTRTQSLAWSAGYVLFVALCAAGGFFSLRSAARADAISDPAREASDLGAEIQWFDDQPPAIVESNALLGDKGRLATLALPDPSTAPRMQDRVEAVRLLRSRAGGERIVEGWVEGPCAMSADLRGVNTLMLDFHDDPGFVRVRCRPRSSNRCRRGRDRLAQYE